MKPLRRSLVQWLATALITAPLGSARAEAPEVVRVHLQLTASDTCATASALTARVAARSSRVVFVTDAATRPELIVSVTREAQRVQARLVVLWPDARRSERQVSDASCEQAVDALALLIALTLDPSAANTPGAGRDSAGPPNQGGERAPATRSEADDVSAAREASDAMIEAESAAREPVSAAGVAGERRASESSASAAVSGASSDLRFDHVAVGLGPHLLGGAAPVFMPGIALQLRVALTAAAPWAPALQLSAAHLGSPHLREPGGRAQFQLAAVQLELCPWALPFGPVLTRVCGAGSAGSLRASGTHTFDPASRSRLWLTLGASLAAEWPLAGFSELQLRVALAAPLLRDAFAFSPTTFYRVAALSLDLSLCLSLRFAGPAQ